MKAHRLIAAILGLAAAFTAATAAAQQPSRNATAPRAEQGYEYVFTDDPLQAAGLDATAPRILVVTHADRATLIRPRTAFVIEMLKSVEGI